MTFSIIVLISYPIGIARQETIMKYLCLVGTILLSLKSISSAALLQPQQGGGAAAAGYVQVLADEQQLLDYVNYESTKGQHLQQAANEQQQLVQAIQAEENAKQALAQAPNQQHLQQALQQAQQQVLQARPLADQALKAVRMAAIHTGMEKTFIQDLFKNAHVVPYNWVALDKIRMTYLRAVTSDAERSSFEDRETNLKARLETYFNQILHYKGVSCSSISREDVKHGLIQAGSILVTGIALWYTNDKDDARILLATHTANTAWNIIAPAVMRLVEHYNILSCKSNQANISSIHKVFYKEINTIKKRSYLIKLLTYSMVLFDQDGHTAVDELETVLLSSSKIEQVGKALFK